MKWIALKETTHCIPNTMREKKTQQALIGTSYSSTGLNQMEVFGFANSFVKIACDIITY
jgi:hypothetical protein